MGRRSARSEEGCCVVEGAVLLGEAVRAGWSIDSVFVDPQRIEPAELRRHGIDADALPLAAGVMERVASTQTPQPVIAIVRLPALDPAERLTDASFAVVADRVQDPGNLGTVMRSAEAAGADAVVLTPGTVDPFNPKVIRSSAGALFHLPPLMADLSAVRSAGLRLVATSSHAEQSIYTADFRGRLALIVGNEAHGVEPDAPVDEWVTISHAGRTESLNVAMATTVVCFEIARQRRSARA